MNEATGHIAQIMCFNFKREGNDCCCMVNISHLKIFFFGSLCSQDCVGSSKEIIDSGVNGIAIHYLRKLPVLLLRGIPLSLEIFTPRPLRQITAVLTAGFAEAIPLQNEPSALARQDTCVPLLRPPVTGSDERIHANTLAGPALPFASGEKKKIKRQQDALDILSSKSRLTDTPT